MNINPMSAGVKPDSVRGSRTGVFIGASASESHEAWSTDPDTTVGYSMTGCTRSMFANRLSFFFDFKGTRFLLYHSYVCRIIYRLGQDVVKFIHFNVSGFECILKINMNTGIGLLKLKDFLKHSLSISSDKYFHFIIMKTLLFTGPSYAVDTACSSSLLALDHALHSIRAGHCDSALVGGANLTLKPAVAAQFLKLGMLSPDGMCKSFDAEGRLKFLHCQTVLFLFS